MPITITEHHLCPEAIVHTLKTVTSILPYQSERESNDETLELVIQLEPPLTRAGVHFPKPTMVPSSTITNRIQWKL